MEDAAASGETEPAPAPTQVQWLTLLPPVPPTGEASTAPALPIPGITPDVTMQDAPDQAERVCPPDKGELIWSAELIVTHGDEISAQLPDPAKAGDDQQEPEEKSPNHENGGKLSRKQAESAERDPPAPSSEPFEVPEIAGIQQANILVEPSSKTKVPDPIDPPAKNSLPTDAARPMRPSQIATLLVDVPARGEGNAPMRLAISQRGDQVNVRLRSWDAAAAPLESHRMQPLLHSLAEIGYASKSQSGNRIDESIPIASEPIGERRLATVETGAGNNDPRSFQNQSEQQRKNQDRQQQALLRRRRSNLGTKSNSSLFQPGAIR